MTKSFIPYSCQSISSDDIDAVVKVLQSDFIAQGPVIDLFERDISEYCESRHAIVMSSATAGLHLGLLSLGIGKGSMVWTSPISFVSSSNAALMAGAKIDFVDVNPVTGNICISELEEKLEASNRKNTLPEALIVVHFAGRTCDMEAIFNLCMKYDIKIIEDAAHAFGGRYSDHHKVGNCRYSDLAVFSFHAVKSITTGEGGAVTTNNPALAEKLKKLRTHGITRDPAVFRDAAHGGWYYEQQDLGYNYRMTDIQAALGSSQIKRVDCFIEKRKDAAKRYIEIMADSPVSLPPLDANSAWHLFRIGLKSKHCNMRSSIFDHMKTNNIGVNVHYIPIHTQPFYKGLGFKKGDFPKAEKYYSESISIPLFPDISQSQQLHVNDTLLSALE